MKQQTQNSKKGKNKGGAPSKYSKIVSRLDEVEKLAKFGLTDAQLALFFDVTSATINNYKIAHPEFFDTLKKGKLIADTDVIYSLYRKAIGFEYEELSQEGVEDGKGGIKIKVVKKTKKYYPPDTTAIIYWLRNRQKWIDKLDPFDGLDDIKEIPEFDKYTDEQLTEYISKNRN